MNNPTQNCPLCAEEIPLAATRCEYCGTQFVVTSKGYCQTCHTVREADAGGHCRVCNNQLADWRIESKLKEEPVPQAEPVQQKPVTPSKGEATELLVLPIKGEGVGQRFGSVFLDAILISILPAAGILLFFLISQGVEGLTQFDAEAWLANFENEYILWMIPLIWFFYFFLFEAAFGATPGKAASSLRVIRKGGGRIAWWQAAVRALFSIFETNPIGAIIIWSTPLKQRLGDLVAGTLVVQKEKVHKAEFRPPSLSLEFHDYRRVEFAQITAGILYKYGAYRILRLRGLAADGSPLKLTLRGYFFRSEFDMLRLNIEHRYGMRFPERFMFWRPIFGVIILIALGIALPSILNMKDHKPAEIVSAILDTRTPQFSATPPSTPTPQPTSTNTPTRTATPEPVEVTFDTIGDYPVGRQVILIGRLALFSSTYCNYACGLLLENPAKTSQKITIFVTVGDGPNKMSPLPDSYTKGDIRVHLDDGTQAVIGYRIRVTGRVCSTTSNEPCIDSITKIELFQVK